MSDRLTPSERSALMAKVRSKDTKPELTVRKTAHRLGYRFRLHRTDLPGTPDLVFPRHRLAVFVHGCFWHRHPSCRRATMPMTNVAKWVAKFERNGMRDARSKAELEAIGWSVLVIWECETRFEKTVADRLSQGMSGKHPRSQSALDKTTSLINKGSKGACDSK